MLIKRPDVKISELKVAFEKTDGNSDGKISVAEARLFIQSINSSTTVEQLQSLMNDFDPYGNLHERYRENTMLAPYQRRRNGKACF